MSGTSTTNQATSTSYSPQTISEGQQTFQNAQPLATYNPYSGPTVGQFGSQFGTATNAATNALTPNSNLQGAGSTLNSIVGSINPTAGPSQYMNPYVQATLAPTLQNLGIANQQANQATAANATMNGAYGGSQQGVQTALNNMYYGQNVNNASGQAYSNAYNSAVQQQQQSLQTLLGAGTAQTGLGTTENTNTANLASLLSGQGQAVQGANQQGITNQMSLATQANTMPLQQQQQLASILATIPQNTTGTSQTQAPNNIGYALLGSLLAGI